VYFTLIAHAALLAIAWARVGARRWPGRPFLVREELLHALV
jgi:hypothetical protein